MVIFLVKRRRRTPTMRRCKLSLNSIVARRTLKRWSCYNRASADPVGEQYILDAAGLEDGRQKENIEPRYVGYK